MSLEEFFQYKKVDDKLKAVQSFNPVLNNGVFKVRPTTTQRHINQANMNLQELVHPQLCNVETTIPCNKAFKFKAVQFPMSMLKIGSFEFKARYVTELGVKCYYARRKLAWEILSSQNGLKYKIEIQWQNISAIRVVTEKNSPGILEIELDKVPSFFQEIQSMPKKRAKWIQSQDFTLDQAASQYRRHYLEFAPGVLDKHLEKILQCDNRLLELSQGTFPSSLSPYFVSAMDIQSSSTLEQQPPFSDDLLDQIDFSNLDDMPDISIPDIELDQSHEPLTSEIADTSIEGYLTHGDTTGTQIQWPQLDDEPEQQQPPNENDVNLDPNSFDHQWFADLHPLDDQWKSYSQLKDLSFDDLEHLVEVNWFEDQQNL